LNFLQPCHSRAGGKQRMAVICANLYIPAVSLRRGKNMSSDMLQAGTPDVGARRALPLHPYTHTPSLGEGSSLRRVKSKRPRLRHVWRVISSHLFNR
jgi:hypothetical protein